MFGKIVRDSKRDSSQRSVSFDVITSSYVASSLDMLKSDYCNLVYEQNSDHSTPLAVVRTHRPIRDDPT